MKNNYYTVHPMKWQKGLREAKHDLVSVGIEPRKNMWTTINLE